MEEETRNPAGGGRGDKGEKGCVGCSRGAASPHGGRGGRRLRAGESGAGHSDKELLNVFHPRGSLK